MEKKVSFLDFLDFSEMKNSPHVLHFFAHYQRKYGEE